MHIVITDYSVTHSQSTPNNMTFITEFKFYQQVFGYVEPVWCAYADLEECGRTGDPPHPHLNVTQL